MDHQRLRRKNQEGATAVEMAIIFPLLIIFIFGIIEFSLMLYNKNIITHAVREGVRFGTVYSQPRVTTSAIEDIVNSYIGNNLVSFSSTDAPNVTVSGSCPSIASSNQELIVTVDYTYTFLLLPNFLASFFSGGLSNGIPVGAEARLICE
jgi:Flp pilus assembly protein TadG